MAFQKPIHTAVFRFLLVTLIVLVLAAVKVEGIGVIWGMEATHPLPPEKVVQLLKSNRIPKVRLLDARPEILRSLNGSGVTVTLGLPNSMLPTLNSSFKAAVNWVHENLTQFVSSGAGASSSRLLFDYIAVGDDLFHGNHRGELHPLVVGAAENIQKALLKANLAENVKLVFPCSFDALVSVSGLPSKTRFRRDINVTMIQLLTFLNRHQSPFFITISPFTSYTNFTLDFALFRETSHPINDTHKNYTNLFDLRFDAVVSALSAAGFPKMGIVVSETGWPSDGAPNATPDLAKEFNTGLINHLDTISSTTSKPLEVYISSLYDEDNRSISTGDFQRHWGIFTFDGQAKYELNLGQGSRKLANIKDVQYLQPRWCVVNENLDMSNASSVAMEACAGADCSAMAQGSSCSNLSWPGNVSYAFNSYYQQHDQAVGSCGFSGLGLLTTVDPSVDRCRFVVGIKTSNSTPFSPWMVSLLFVLSFCVLLFI